MKFLLAFILLTAVATAQTPTEEPKPYTYLFPEAPCKWGATVEATSTTGHMKKKTWVFGNYKKEETYNHNGDLIGAEVVRADIMGGMKFSYGELPIKCKMASSESETGWGYDSVVGKSDSYSFDHAEDAKYNGHKCIMYYNDRDGEPDRDNAIFVDTDGFIIGKIETSDEMEQGVRMYFRTVSNYTYHSGSKVLMSDFTLSERDIYGCPDERIYHNPDSYFAQCAASTTSVIIGVVAATLLSALVF